MQGSSKIHGKQRRDYEKVYASSATSENSLHSWFFKGS